MLGYTFSKAKIETLKKSRFQVIDFQNLAFVITTIHVQPTIFLQPIKPCRKRIHFQHNADFIHERNNMSGYNDFVNGHR